MTIINIKSALVSAGLMALVAVLTVILQGGNIFALDIRSLANVAILAFLTGLVSFIKSSLTSDVGKFAGIQIK